MELRGWMHDLEAVTGEDAGLTLLGSSEKQNVVVVGQGSLLVCTTVRGSPRPCCGAAAGQLDLLGSHRALLNEGWTVLGSVRRAR